MFERLQKLLDRIESRIALWQILQGVAVVSSGGITGWLSTGVAWINQYGLFGWWTAALGGALAMALILLLVAWFRQAWVKASAVRAWKDRQTDNINPLDSEFVKKRIRLGDLASPINNTISDKRFIDCEIIGPVNVVLSGTEIGQSQFFRHDLVMAGDNPQVLNAVLIKNCLFHKCQIDRVTFVILQQDIPANLLEDWSNWITPKPATASELPLGTVTGRLPKTLPD